MPIKFRCPSCGQTLGIARRKAGTVVSCPKCSYPATVPNDDPVELRTEASSPPVMATPAAPAIGPGRSKDTPLFERKDFDRFIGAGAAEAGGGAAVAEKPRVSGPPPARASRSEGTSYVKAAEVLQPRSASIDLRLAVAVSLALGLIGFGAGFFAGRSAASGPVAPGRVGGDAKANAGGKAAAAAESAPADASAKGAVDEKPALSLNGSIRYKAGDKIKPDVGSRILIFPINRRPVKKLALQGLRPGEEAAADQEGVERFRQIGGVIATVDAEGNFAAHVAEGAYWVLILSKNCARGAPLQLLPEDAPLREYFLDVGQLVGENDYEFVSRRNRDTKDGGGFAAIKRVFGPAKGAGN